MPTDSKPEEKKIVEYYEEPGGVIIEGYKEADVKQRALEESEIIVP